MRITGEQLIAGQWVAGTGPAFQAVDPATGQPLPETFHEAGLDQIETATRAAAGAAAAYRRMPLDRRAAALDAAADAIDALGDRLTERVVAETGLPPARATGERGRTVGQLRMFAELVRSGEVAGARHDPALPERTPLPRPELRLAHVPLGPVAVFGASNFPLAFSVAGGDTASALAAGCPVVAKAHPAHPGVSELVARAVAEALAGAGVPDGAFSLVHGGVDVGQALVRDPRISAVGFTGSRRGGLALVETARSRIVPIPVFAEMSSVNPVVVLPGALADVQSLAIGYAASLTREAGQYCTNPGLLFLPEGEAGDAVIERIRLAVNEIPSQPMLTEAISQARIAGAARHRSVAGVSVVADGPGGTVLSTDLATFAGTDQLQEEVFGPVGLVVRYPSTNALAPVVAQLEGQLTATLFGSDTDLASACELLPVLEDRAGRVIWNAWPTGVEVAPAMVHGGPWPATSAPATTSVGTLAIARWLRPVCYQGLPDQLLPPELS
ncbi:MAG TPA: aldehyde dehydrogenase (NADP(+)) [Dermatophilaceae bacterium]|nr:aldehyde dehydrogenase (NADP(+)) [Dermatophilaceae bacterium]